MKKTTLLFLLFAFFGCKNKCNDSETSLGDIYEKSFRTFKVEDSKIIDLDSLWAPFQAALYNFSDHTYNILKPIILDQDIPTLQQHIDQGRLSYELLVKFYLYRIKSLDRKNDKSLNSVISLNTRIVKQAKEKDNNRPKNLSNFSLYGMPLLLKDNINYQGMVTTAGAVALLDNVTDDAFMTEQLKASGALILGKANLSEWAYFFCGDCPSGYSAVGGQTFNPFGRKTLDTGGSSSGSAVAVAANFCAAAIGSETSGSILSPASQNAAVGLKPTVGAISRSGIVPISSTLDTAGPITQYIIDNVLVYNALIGKDSNDFKSKAVPKIDLEVLKNSTYKGKRFGAIRGFLDDSLYNAAVDLIKTKGAEIIIVDPKDQALPGFLRLLNLDMQADLPLYFENFSSKNNDFNGVQSIIDFNNGDSLNRAPYGQKIFQGIVSDTATKKEFKEIKNILKANGRAYFEQMMKAHQLDGVLSINNYHAGYAAVAEYPALTVPMGLSLNSEPKGLTFIAKPFCEADLYNWGYHYEKAAQPRPSPKHYN